MILSRARADDVPAMHDVVERAYGGYVERIGRRPAPMDDDYDERIRPRGCSSLTTTASSV